MLDEVCGFLKFAGAKHAPLHGFADPKPGDIEMLPRAGKDGRYVCLTDPPGVYFLLGTDNPHWRKRLDDEVQIIFNQVTPIVEPFAEAIGYRAGAIEQLPVVWAADEEPRSFAPVYSVMLRP